MKKRLITFLILISVCLSLTSSLELLTGAASTSIADDQAALKELQALQDSIKAKRYSLSSTIKDINGDYENAVAEKLLLENNISLIEQEITTTDALISAYQLQLDELDTKLYDQSMLLEKYYDIYGKILCYYNEQGNAGTFEILLSSKSISDFLTRLDYLSYVMEYNNKIVEQISLAASDIESTRELYAKSNDSLLANQSELEATKSELITEQQKLDTLLNTLDGTISLTENQVLQLKQDELDFQEKIDQLTKQIAEKYTYLEGDYSWPIDSAYWSSDSVVITSEYGKRVNPITGRNELHNGLDIKAPAGTPIQAVKGGIVIRSEFSSGYGNVIVIAHEDGTSTLYGHCSKLLVEKGSSVVQNQVIARVGTTGISSGNHLHFTVYEGNKTVNPIKYLDKNFINALNKRNLDLE